jgi:hypothetical protein
LVAAGCTSEDDQQHAARAAAERWLGGRGEVLRCTDAAGIWLADLRTEEFLCTIRRPDRTCALLRVALPDGAPRARIEEPRADCVQPF